MAWRKIFKIKFSDITRHPKKTYLTKQHEIAFTCVIFVLSTGVHLCDGVFVYFQVVRSVRNDENLNTRGSLETYVFTSLPSAPSRLWFPALTTTRQFITRYISHTLSTHWNSVINVPYWSNKNLSFFVQSSDSHYKTLLQLKMAKFHLEYHPVVPVQVYRNASRLNMQLPSLLSRPDIPVSVWMLFTISIKSDLNLINTGQFGETWQRITAQWWKHTANMWLSPHSSVVGTSQLSGVSTQITCGWHITALWCKHTANVWLAHHSSVV